MTRPKFHLAIVLSILALALLMLPSLSGCSNSGLPTEPGVTDFNREPFFEQMPGMRHFTIQPVGPPGMFGQDGYSPICEDAQPVFSVKIYAPSDGPLANVLNVTIHTAIDGQEVKNKSNPITGTVDFSPSAPLSTGRHSAVIQLTLENNAYPPVVSDWMFDVYNEPPRITSVLVDDAKNQAIIFFDRPVPKVQIKDLDRWKINSESFALNIDVLPGLMSAFINVEQDFPQVLVLPIPVILEFLSDKGSTTITLSKGFCGKSGSRTGQVWPDCAPVDEGDFTAFPGSGNPHHFFESEFSAWCYRMVVEPNHCPIRDIADYTTGCIEHVFAWDEMEPDCGFSRDADNPTISNITTGTGGLIIEDPPCYDDPSCFYHTFTYSPSTSIAFSGDIRADNDLMPPPPEELDFETYVGEAAVSFGADLMNPEIICGPYILTGWQAAREIEGLISDPGDSVFHYGLWNPPTVEEYIEKLRTEWADHIFVFAGGADPGGSLFPYVPLELDTWTPLQPCAPTVAITDGFLLMRDYYPLGALPSDEDYGDETIPWADSMSYPQGYPIDGSAYREEQYALWDLTAYGYVDDICDEDGFSMRVRVTDHVGNWKRSGMIEDMQIGIPGVDSGVKVDFLSFYEKSPTGTPEFLYAFCDIDCDNPQSCNPLDNKASSIERRDEDGNCILHLVAYCTALSDIIPDHITAVFSSNEPYVPEGVNCSPIKYVTMDRVLSNSVQPFIDLTSYLGDLCFDVIYICDVEVTDVKGDPGPLYVSHNDEAYPNYPFSEECEDYTVIYDPREEPIEFKRYAQAFHYGNKRGEGHLCNSHEGGSEASYFSEDRYIQIGGFHAVTGTVDNKETYRPVQSAADLIIVASHGLHHNGLPLGLPGLFEARSGGCVCPPLSNPFKDSCVFSPLLLYSGGGILYDNDFEDNPNDNSDFGGYFWQNQLGYDRVTWVLFLGCGILNTSNTFGYIPLEEWANHIGHADAICGYKSYGMGVLDAVDYVGNRFSLIMKHDFTENEHLYACDPPPGYFYRPIRAWMEANCLAANEFNWKMKRKAHRESRIYCTQAVSVDWENNVWILEDRDNDGKFLINIE